MSLPGETASGRRGSGELDGSRLLARLDGLSPGMLRRIVTKSSPIVTKNRRLHYPLVTILRNKSFCLQHMLYFGVSGKGKEKLIAVYEHFSGDDSQTLLTNS